MVKSVVGRGKRLKGFGLANIAGVGVRGFRFYGNGFPEGPFSEVGDLIISRK